MADFSVICEAVRADGVKGAMPYVIGIAAVLLTACAAVLFVPIIMLIRKIAISLGCIRVRSYHTYIDQYDDAPPIQRAFLPHKKGEVLCEADAPIPIHPNKIIDNDPDCYWDNSGNSPKLVKTDVDQKTGQAESNDDQFAVPKTTVYIQTHCKIVDTINTLVAANNTFYAIIFFIMLTLVVHMGIIAWDVGMRTMEYQQMWKAFNRTMQTVNASASTIEPVTAVINQIMEYGKP